MTRVDIFNKWNAKEMTTKEAIEECRKAPVPTRISDGSEKWAEYDGSEDNLPTSLWLLVEEGECDRKDMKRFFDEVVSVADKDVSKKTPNYKDAKKAGFDTKQINKAKKTGVFSEKL